MAILPMRSPVAFIIFNRPELTERVFAEIARAQPSKLLVIADGPRPESCDDMKGCAAARAVIERVNWPCEVFKAYSETNMGCARRPATGLRWVFDQVDEAIILEDDCVPHPSFFRYCDELLERYRDDERIMHISGDQFIVQREVLPFSYSFSNYCLSWGWATWRRAFRHYDPEIKLWPTLRETQWLSEILDDKWAVEHWSKIFDLTFSGIEKVNTWDFQWVFACWAQRGLSILPGANLISNIGFGEHATHTKHSGDRRANLNTSDMKFPLKHPPYVLRDLVSDCAIFEQLIRPQHPRGIFHGMRRKCKAAIPSRVRGALGALRSLFN